jgi:hypothetical protein
MTKAEIRPEMDELRVLLQRITLAPAIDPLKYLEQAQAYNEAASRLADLQYQYDTATE